MSPWNSDRGQLKAGTLISKRHVIFAKHFPIAVGSRIVFVGEDGVACPCRIAATKAIAGSDIMIASLDYEVTPNIHPAKVLPSDYARWIGSGAGLPTVTFNQREELFVNDLDGLATNAFRRFARSYAPKSYVRTRFRRELIMGDSGNPSFLVVNGEAILLYCLTGGHGGSGAPPHRYRYEIQQAMDELCPGYKLEEFDFSKIAGG